MVQKQMAYMLGRQQIFLELDEDMVDSEELTELMSNSHLNNNFLALAREVKYTQTYGSLCAFAIIHHSTIN